MCRGSPKVEAAPLLAFAAGVSYLMPIVRGVAQLRSPRRRRGDRESRLRLQAEPDPVRAWRLRRQSRWFESFKDFRVFTVYILWSESMSRYYTGSCIDLAERLQRHNQCRNISTRSGVPWKVVYTEVFEKRSDALRRENQIKSNGAGRFLVRLGKKQ